MPVMFRKNIFEEKPGLRVPRLQVPQQNSWSTNNRAVSPLSRSPMSRSRSVSPFAREGGPSRSVSPLAREVPKDMFMIPEDSPTDASEYRLPHYLVNQMRNLPRSIPRSMPSADDDAESVHSGPPSPRFFPRSEPINLPLSNNSSPTDPGAPFEVAPFPGDQIGRGRSPEPKILTQSPPPLIIATLPSPPPTATATVLEIPMLPPPVTTEDSVTNIELEIKIHEKHTLEATQIESPPCSPPATPPLCHSGSDSENDNDEPAEVEVPEFNKSTDNDNIRRSSDPGHSNQVVIQDNDPDSLDMNMHLIRAATMPAKATHWYDPLARPSRRFIRSMDHQAARGIFGRTVNLGVHNPSGFLVKFMLRVANKLIKGARIYVYYWGDWKKGKVRGKGGRVAEKSGSLDMSPPSPEDHEKMGLLSDEDDYGVKISGRKRKPWQRRDSV
ncbi:hypothetical protein ABW20_dc0100724 [Dactylellina cionopaga]|nr:hypothetical protein ABW20_dc0100724 [Dactylellina cionopaga]